MERCVCPRSRGRWLWRRHRICFPGKICVAWWSLKKSSARAMLPFDKRPCNFGLKVWVCSSSNPAKGSYFQINKQDNFNKLVGHTNQRLMRVAACALCVSVCVKEREGESDVLGRIIFSAFLNIHRFNSRLRSDSVVPMTL